MMDWRAIVPLKSPDQRKTRLALPAWERLQLSERMATHVLATLSHVSTIGHTAVLSPDRREGWGWIRDQGRGLNIELTEARRAWLEHPILIIHGDLPHLTADDVRQLIEAAHDMAAIAPDRHDIGTNAIALPAGMALNFAFGADSFRTHLDMVIGARVVRAHGLGLDLDTSADLLACREKQSVRRS